MQKDERYKRSCLPYIPIGHISGLAWGVVLSEYRKSRSSVMVRRKVPTLFLFYKLHLPGIQMVLNFNYYEKNVFLSDFSNECLLCVESSGKGLGIKIR